MSSKSKTPTNQEIVDGFNKLRTEQRAFAQKLSEIEGDTADHSIVIDALKKVDKDRKCYRLVGGVLVERKVGDVLPALEKNKIQISQLAEVLNKQLQEKGKELNSFKEKFNIKIHGPGATEDAPKEKPTTKSTTGVLVADNSS